MKDLLDREIVVGDTLAYSVYHKDLGSELKLSKITDVSSFSVLSENDGVFTNPQRVIICDWAKGSDAAK